MKKSIFLAAALATCAMASDGNWEGEFKLPGGTRIVHTAQWTKIESPDGGTLQAEQGINITAQFIQFGDYQPHGGQVDLTTNSTPQKFYTDVLAFALVVEITPPTLAALLAKKSIPERPLLP